MTRTTPHSARLLRQLDLGDHAAVHLVGAVGQPQRAGAGPRRGQREVVGHAAAAVQLDRHVDDVWAISGTATLISLTSDSAGRGCPGCRAATRRAAPAAGPGRWRSGRRRSARGCRRGWPAACRTRPALVRGGRRARGPSRPADQPHAVVDAAGTEPALRDLERPARARAGCCRPARGRRSNDTSPWPSGSSYSPIAVSIRSTFTPGVSRGTSTIVCRECRSASGSVRPHEDEDLAVGVADAGRPPLAAVDHDLVAVDDGGRGHVGRVGGGDVGLGHAERAADLGRRAAARATARAARRCRT